MTDNRTAGLYLHIPFCGSKCAYCDFYSVFPNKNLIDSFTDALIVKIKQWGGIINRPIDTVYIGGGTPSLLNERIIPLIGAVKNSFDITETAEITVEMNPSDNCSEFITYAKAAGINRLSIGVQSGNDDFLKVLGRRHSADQAIYAVNSARKAGFHNISLDIMLGLPGSDSVSLENDLNFICSLDPEHISAYILKIEENTKFYKIKESLPLPDDDESADQYLSACRFFEKKGYSHYEISNFAKPGYESRHNLKYWRLDDYLGIGPAAHSLINGKRFYYPKDVKSFISGNKPMFEGKVSKIEEYLMLSLRTKKGFIFSDYKSLSGISISDIFTEKCSIYVKNGLGTLSSESFSLTDKGMLVSNLIINELMECI